MEVVDPEDASVWGEVMEDGEEVAASAADVQDRGGGGEEAGEGFGGVCVHVWGTDSGTGAWWKGWGGQ